MNTMNPGITPPERQARFRLQDGRILAWSEWGPVGGLPILFCTGAAMSGYLGFGTDHLPRLGLRLMAVDRPGLGASDPHPQKTLASWVEDLRQLFQASGLYRVAAVGFSQGAPFALALAAGGLVQAVALVSGQDQLTHPDLAPLLHPEVAAMLEALQNNPAGFEAQIAQMATPEWLWQFILQTSAEHDRALYSSQPFSQAYQRSLQEGFVQGAGGYARDLVNALQPWPFEPEGISVPVDLWYGALDTSTVHSPDFGATLARRLPRASRILDPAEGGSILWNKAGEILARLALHLGSSPAFPQGPLYES